MRGDKLFPMTKILTPHIDILHKFRLCTLLRSLTFLCFQSRILMILEGMIPLLTHSAQFPQAETVMTI